MPDTFPLLESIFLKDGQFRHLGLHQQRIDYSRKQALNLEDNLNLESFLSQHEIPQQGIFKCRILYGKQFAYPELIAYNYKPINSLKIVEADALNYALKYSNREAINEIYKKRESCDDVLFVKQGFITDSSYCNIAFRAGSHWFTPDKPLLKGVQRQFLLNQGIIHEQEIRLSDLARYSSFKLFNAMIDWQLAAEIPVEAIR
ncbi:MAG: aminotransferase class IV [Bacteroidales bacterium]|nr:aminotransferase class IV [Bacteroidales bacterium]